MLILLFWQCVASSYIFSCSYNLDEGLQLDDLDLSLCTHLKIGMLKITPELDVKPIDSDWSKLQADLKKLAADFPKLLTILKLDVGHDKVTFCYDITFYASRWCTERSSEIRKYRKNLLRTLQAKPKLWALMELTFMPFATRQVDGSLIL